MEEKRKVFQHWDLFSSETLVGQHHGLKGLAGVLQVVSESFHKWRLIHEGNSTVGPNDSHSLAWWGAGERVEGSVWVRTLERGDWSNFCIEIEGPLGNGKHKLFGIRRQLAWDGSSQRVHGKGKGFVVDQPWWGDGVGRAGDHPLLGSYDDNARTRGYSRVPALLHLRGAKFGGGEAGCGEGDWLRCWPGAGWRVDEAGAWRRWGGCVGGMSAGIGGSAGSGVTEQPWAR